MTLRDVTLRVSKRRTCPICKKRDWCLVSLEGGGDPVFAICKRVESAHVWGDAGWFHRLSAVSRSRTRTRTVELDAGGHDFADLAREYEMACPAARRAHLASTLGVSVESLARLALGWDERAYTVPMQDGLGRVRGIRRRFPNGKQVCVTGSKNGIFVPRGLTHTGLLLVCEGASDAAAMLDLGFEAIGRADCNSGRKQVLRHVRKHRPEAVVVVADNDVVGRRGAGHLALALTLHCAHVRVITPPESIKDAREWRRRGATRAQAEAVILGTPEVVLVARRRRIGGRR
jgi:hypothetical protein